MMDAESAGTMAFHKVITTRSDLGRMGAIKKVPLS